MCSRAIIIDRGTIVANGTPQELKRRSENAGAVTLSLAEGLAASVMAKVNQISGVARSVVISESPLTVRAFPGKNGDSADVALALGEVAAREKWRIRELHTEEGRLDEVFRSITLPDTDLTGKGEKV